MYANPDARGHGYGHRVLQHLERSAAEAGITRILLETGRDNTDALTLYTRSGYQPIAPYAPGRNPVINRALAKRLA
jgi:ribosomal protein S18 acetylase RimI-like enzyme